MLVGLWIETEGAIVSIFIVEDFADSILFVESFEKYLMYEIPWVEI